jgi:uncharacterized protein YndB with AHSA1/START domain
MLRAVLAFDLERSVPAPPEAAFTLLTDPEQMNRWSEARVEGLAPGDGGHPGGVGALRRVAPKLGGREPPFYEVIERAEAPRRIEYRVFAPADLVRHHRGTISIEASSGGSRVRWRVEAELGARPIEWIAKAALVPALDRSLDALARVAAEGVPRRPLPPTRDLADELEIARRIRPEADRCVAAQRRRADALLGAGDDRGWFARIYQFVSEEQLRGVDEVRFDHPAWVLRLLLAFHPLWEDNLARRLGEIAGDVEPHWIVAHRIAERLGERRAADDFTRCTEAVRAGVRAHIEEDLPRAIAKVHLAHYARRVDLARFRADYLRMGAVFEAAGARMRVVLPRSEWPVVPRMLDLVTPEAMWRRILDEAYYPVGRRRREAFERAERIVAVLG